MDLTERPIDLAVELVRAGAELVVVGGVARRLLGSAHAPAHLDIRVERGAVGALVQALRALGADTTGARLMRSGCSRVDTTYGPLDVFVGPRPPCVPASAGGRVLQVAT